MSPGEHHPTVECGCTLFATSARPHPKIGSSPLDDIAKPDLLVGHKSRQAYSVTRQFALVS
jgi:hypothetical protein